MNDQQFERLIANLRTMNNNICALAKKIDNLNANIVGVTSTVRSSDTISSKISKISDQLTDIKYELQGFPK